MGWVPLPFDPDAIHDNVSGEINAVTGKATPVGADLLLIEDSAASFAKKKIAISALPGVTSVAVSGSDGIEVDSGSPITTTGTIALGVNAATMRTHLAVLPLAGGEMVGTIDLNGNALLNANNLPWGRLGHAEVSTNQGSITTETDLTNLAVAVTVGSGRYIRITAYVHLESSVSGDNISLFIKEGSTYHHLHQKTHAVAGLSSGSYASCILAPSSGSHTYKLSAGRSYGATGTITLAATSDREAFILVEDIGPA